MIKRTSKLILLFFLLAANSISAQDNVIDQVIWVVGDEAILKSDIEQVRIEMLARGERLNGDPYCFIPEQLAVQKLFLDQAKIDSITVTNADISRQVSYYENMYISNMGSKEKVEEYLKAPMAKLREEWREDIRNNYMVEQVQDNITKDKVKLTPSEVRRYYSQLPQDSLPYMPTTVEVQIITHEPVVPLDEVNRIKARLREYSEKIQSGKEDFSTLAIIHSDDTGSALNGGELPFYGRAELDPSFANMAFSLNDPTKVSNIVETEFGYHIIQLVERRGDRIKVRHILLRPKIADKERKEATNRMDSLVRDIRAEKFTFEEATVLSADEDTRANNGLMVNKSESRSYSGTSRFRMEDLPPEVSKVVDKMKVNEISEPFLMKLSNEKEVVAIVKLRSRTEGHVANISDDYQALKAIVEQRKRQEVLSKWVKDKINSTYIYIDKNWMNCDFKYEGWVK
ncbi:peptidylprolyl isomerase [Dysgonomonas sp. 25]|uniref:peptidylprolyl isomerase n=1 Tax=Dysgonomonas sp. 25 TaxID=2302933 RepID=UPI0013D6F933|nr:peptidylprolyl isomerase [Dysgonomonas sp. 25]NDV68962.1 peptidylprolyl isomerase [Dysgonomonas sp. 25]